MLNLGSISFKLAEVFGSHFTATATDPKWFTVGSIDIGLGSIANTGMA